MRDLKYIGAGMARTQLISELNDVWFDTELKLSLDRIEFEEKTYHFKEPVAVTVVVLSDASPRFCMVDPVYGLNCAADTAEELIGKMETIFQLYYNLTINIDDSLMIQKGRELKKKILDLVVS